MNVEVPTEIGLYGLVENVDNIGTTHGNMVLEAVLTDVLHQLLQVVDLGHSDATVHAIGVVGDFSLTEIGLDAAFGIVGRNTEEGEGAFADLRIDSTKGINFAQSSSEHPEGAELQIVVAHELTGEVTTVGADTLVAILCEIVVPVKQRWCVL